MKNDKTYVEVKEVVDEMIFLVEISHEMLNGSQKTEDFLNDYHRKFSQNLKNIEDGSENSIEFYKGNLILSNIFLNRDYFRQKYLIRLQFLKEKHFMAENQEFPQISIQNDVHSGEKKLKNKGFCCSESKKMKEKM